MVLRVDAAKAALYGIPAAEVARAAQLALAGDDITPLHDGEVEVRDCRCVSGLAPQAKGGLDALLKLKLRGTLPTADGRTDTYEVALAELVTPTHRRRASA